MGSLTNAGKPSSRFDITIIDEGVVATQDGVVPKAGFVEQDTDLAMSTMVANPRQEVLTLLQRHVSKHLVLQCDMIHAVHGTAVKDGSLATLVVFQFTFAPRSPDRRFKKAQIEITFSDIATVVNMEPKGQFSAEKSSFEKEVSHTISPSLAAEFGPASATMGYTWQRTDKKTVEDAIRVNGMILSHGTTDLRQNQVLWSLIENPQTEKGIPSLLQGAVLLRRSEDTRFSASIVIHGDVDNKRWAQDGWDNAASKMSNKKLPGKDMWFDPNVPIGDNSAINAKELSRVPLESYKLLITVKAWADGTTTQAPRQQPPQKELQKDVPKHTAVELSAAQNPAPAARSVQPDAAAAPDTAFIEPDASFLSGDETEQPPPMDWDEPESFIPAFQPSQEQPTGASGAIQQLLDVEQELLLVRKEEKLVTHLVRARKDLPELSRLVHFLKGSSATLEFTKIKDSCQIIQQYGSNSNVDGSAEPDEPVCLQKIEDALKTVKVDKEILEK